MGLNLLRKLQFIEIWEHEKLNNPFVEDLEDEVDHAEEVEEWAVEVEVEGVEGLAPEEEVGVDLMIEAEVDLQIGEEVDMGTGAGTAWTIEAETVKIEEALMIEEVMIEGVMTEALVAMEEEAMVIADQMIGVVLTIEEPMTIEADQMTEEAIAPVPIVEDMMIEDRIVSFLLLYSKRSKLNVKTF